MKSLLFIIVVYCIFTVFRREGSGRKKKKFFAAYSIRVASCFSLRSCDHFRRWASFDRVLVVPLSSFFLLAGCQRRRSTYFTPKVGKTPRPAVSVRGEASQGETETNKDKQLQILIPKLTRLPNHHPLNKVILIRYHRAWRATCPHMFARACTHTQHAPTTPPSLAPPSVSCNGGGESFKVRGAVLWYVTCFSRSYLSFATYCYPIH